MKMKILSEVRKRNENLKKRMEEEGIKRMLIFNPKNVSYLTGGKGLGKILVNLKEDKSILWVKELYREIDSDFYDKLEKYFELKTDEKNSIKKEILNNKKIKDIYFENLSVNFFNNLEKDLKVKGETTDIIERLRLVKSPYEISLLKKSATLAKKGMKRAYDIIGAGKKESVLAGKIESYMRNLGSEAPPFDAGILLSSGPRSANIHAIPKKIKIENDSTVLVDLGAKYRGYFSDMSRTIKVGDGINVKDEVLIDAIENLELSIIDIIKDGTYDCNALFSFCENKIKKLGLKFYHSLGHGVGLDIHEGPNIGKDSKDVLEENMVFTIEPGVYIPEKYGIRFEDMIYLKKGGGKVEILTKI